MLTVLHECHEGIYFYVNGQYIFQPRQGVGHVLTFEQAFRDILRRDPSMERLADLLHPFALTRLGVSHHGVD